MRPRLAIPALAVIGAVALGGCSGSGDHGNMSMGNGPAGSMAHGDMGMPAGRAGAATATTVAIPADAAFNATDVAFAQGMIPHHGQAVEMGDMALRVSSNPTVRSLAEKIKAAQTPEIVMMQGWLRSWNQPVPEPNQPMDHTNDSMGGMMMSGMMSSEDMARLGNAGGAAFDRMFLQMMVQHHQGAVEMANQQLAGGKYQPAKDLAGAIITTQKQEIDEMNALLARSG